MRCVLTQVLHIQPCPCKTLPKTRPLTPSRLRIHRSLRHSIALRSQSRHPSSLLSLSLDIVTTLQSLEPDPSISPKRHQRQTSLRRQRCMGIQKLLRATRLKYMFYNPELSIPALTQKERTLGAGYIPRLVVIFSCSSGLDFAVTGRTPEFPY